MAHAISSSVPDTKDVRGPTIDHKRVHDRKSKWNRPWAYGHDLSRGLENGKCRPAHPSPLSQLASSGERKREEKDHRKKHALNRKEAAPIARDDDDDDDVAIESEPDLDTEAAFDGTPRSFDSVEGPTAGQQLLGIAMNNAVARWEDKKTTRLIKDEYDVLDAADSDREDAHKQVEDDFELL